MKLSALNAMLENKDAQPDQLIKVLQDMQAEYEYLPREGLHIVSERLGVPLIEIYRVASFYKAFTLMPHGRHSLTLCLGTVCHIRGPPMLLDTARGELDTLPFNERPDFCRRCWSCQEVCPMPIAPCDGPMAEGEEHLCAKCASQPKRGQFVKPERKGEFQ